MSKTYPKIDIVILRQGGKGRNIGISEAISSKIYTFNRQYV